eukprot:1141470-Pelagomonas_calceolata.AAC.1
MLLPLLHRVQAVDESVVDEWLVAAASSPHDHNNPPAEGSTEGPTYSLFGFPAEDNYAGVKFPLDWAKAVKQRSTEQHKWMVRACVLVDAAAFVPTQPLDLSKLDADFVDITFYKLFGEEPVIACYPTGLGALLVRTEAVPLLRKVFWGLRCRLASQKLIVFGAFISWRDSGIGRSVPNSAKNRPH